MVKSMLLCVYIHGRKALLQPRQVHVNAFHEAYMTMVMVVVESYGGALVIFSY